MVAEDYLKLLEKVDNFFVEVRLSETNVILPCSYTNGIFSLGPTVRLVRIKLAGKPLNIAPELLLGSHKGNGEILNCFKCKKILIPGIIRRVLCNSHNRE